MSEHVIISTSANGLRVRMNRLDKKNALTRAMYQTMTEAIEHGDADPAIRTISIIGTGDTFTSGNDLRDFMESPALSDDSPAMSFLKVILQTRKPLLAAVNGLAVGIGVTMLLHCDLVYAAQEAVFQLPFVNIGLVPEAASSLLLPQMIGHHRAAELFFLGKKFDGRTAQTMGLVNAIFPSSELEAALDDLAGTLAAKPPAALRKTKELLKGGAFAAAVARRLSEERRHLEQQLGSAEAREAMDAFFAKRPPDFSRFA